jgi:hypothetical protein
MLPFRKYGDLPPLVQGDGGIDPYYAQQQLVKPPSLFNPIRHSQNTRDISALYSYISNRLFSPLACDLCIIFANIKDFGIFYGKYIMG